MTYFLLAKPARAVKRKRAAPPIFPCFQEEVVASSREKRCTAADEKAALDLAQESLAISPPMLAYVPDRWPNGRPKDICGWQVGNHVAPGYMKKE